jgi:adenylosuccinate lyase
LIHFGLTSEDLNSLSYAVIVKNGIADHLKNLKSLQSALLKKSNQWSSIPLLARTHGQPASPSTLGKEFKVFFKRIDRQIIQIKSIKPMAKWSGATGNFHTFDIVDSSKDWPKICRQFIKQCGIEQNLQTTQIEPHDWIAETCHSMTRINNIMIDLNQDIWMYITNDLFKLKLMKDEVGSSTMPHKVNPIDFENSEGNLGIANSLLDFFANKLQKSRMQRDLSDSTVLRNVGLGFGYSALAILSLNKGLSKLSPNKDKLIDELDGNWEVLTEAVQTIMRYEGIPNAYEQLKNLSRGSSINKKAYMDFVENLQISSESKAKLLELTPAKYIGLAIKLAKS